MQGRIGRGCGCLGRGGGRKDGCRLMRGCEGAVLGGQKCGSHRGRSSMLEGLFHGGLRLDKFVWRGKERLRYFVNLMM